MRLIIIKILLDQNTCMSLLIFNRYYITREIYLTILSQNYQNEKIYERITSYHYTYTYTQQFTTYATLI